jgi:glycerophosphoryl diester phosphodiesterase
MASSPAVTPHPLSVLPRSDGPPVQLKIHGCVWSGEHPENSLSAIRESLRAPVARAEIDINLLRDADFLVTHDTALDSATSGSGAVRLTTRAEAARLRCRWRGRVWDERPPLLSEVVALLCDEPSSPTLLELDAKDVEPWPWGRVEELARLVEPVRERVVFGGCADWNLRRLAEVDPALLVGFTPTFYLDWLPSHIAPDELPGALGAYGYLDSHPLARARTGSTADYLWDRLSALIRLVPGARELHTRLSLFERMYADGLTDICQRLHAAGLLVDVWTLDAGTPNWQNRLARAVEAGVDVVTTNTARQLAIGC